MPRVPLAAVWLLAGLIPLSVGALGLGEISLKSALNQVLVAEIPVTADSSDDLSQLDVRLASAETFQRFGLDRPQFLSTLNFTVERDRILVTSSLPVSEPFVSLLLEINWPQGRLLREYTMLLDPPSFARDGAVQPAAALPATSSPAPAVKRIERPVEQPAGQADGSAQGGSSPGADDRLVAGPDGNSYGPVRANETLWAISERLNTGNAVSLNAMMVALYRANPEAFAGNINLLKRGAILRVPDAAELAALSDSEAASEVRSQNEAWRAGLDSSPGTARLQLVPPEEKPVATPATAGQSPAQADAAQVRALEQQLAESRRLLELKDSQLKALQDRLGGGTERPVEQPVAAPIEAPIERLPVDDNAAAREADEAAVDEAAVDDEATTESAVPVPAERPVARRKPKTGESSWLDSLGGLIFNSYFLMAAAAVVLAGLFVVFGRRRMARADDDSTGRFRTTLPRGSAVGGAAEGEPTLRDGFIVEESEAQRTGEIAARTAIAPAPGRENRKPAATDAETALERTISTDGAVEIDQADVVAEAEFHMAYGLYDQAAELLVRALRDNPDRQDLRLKLLEVYFIWENKPAFLKEAQAFHRQPGAAESANWNKVLIMGKQICPGEVLFAAGAGAAGLDVSLDGDSSDSVDFSLDDEGGESVDLDLTSARPGPAADLLDFDFGEIAGTDDADVDDTGLMKTEIAPGPQSNESPTVEAPAGSDFSPTMETPTVEFRGPDAPTVETPTLETPAAGTMETPTIESTALTGSGRQLADLEGHDHTEEINVEDLGLDLTGLDVAAGDMGTGLHSAIDDSQSDESDGDDGEIFDIGDADADVDEDLSDLLQSLEGDATSEMRSVSLDEGTLDLPEIGTAMEKSAASRDAGSQSPGIDETAEQPRGNFADNALGEQSGELSHVDFDIGDGDVEDAEPTSVVTPGPGRRPEGPTMTEVGTKLDLARAYVDMGDPDGARSILNEVLEEGDPAQQQEARKLLDELAD
ncbi:MAG: FimV/HubP family polar landmark protein [Gammaproteobacteria bacterium]